MRGATRWIVAGVVLWFAWKGYQAYTAVKASNFGGPTLRG